MTSRRLFAVASAVAISAAALAALHASAASSHVSRSATADCVPVSPSHHVDTTNRTGYGIGWVSCDTVRSYSYTVRLYNVSGNILAQRSGTDTAQLGYYQTGSVGCAGAWVHGFIYENFNGVGRSNTDTSSTLC